MGNIPLTGIQNARDLGGIETADGRSIRAKKLLKSGRLDHATEEDIRILTEEYHVEAVMDLRTKQERCCFPDPPIKGAHNVWTPLFSEPLKPSQIFTTEEKDVLETQLKALFIISHKADEMKEEALEEVRNMIRATAFDPEDYMARIYHKFINNQVMQKQLKQFFYLLVQRKEGAILWHCGSGKDRSGICTALLLYALGVTKEDIIKIYGETAESSMDTVDYILDQLFPADDPENEAYRELARRIFGVKTCYIEEFLNAIEKDYISIDNYLQKAIELHVDNLVRLKTLYLV